MHRSPTQCLRILCLLLLLCVFDTARAGIIADYQARCEKLSLDAITAQLEKHPERWDKLSMKFRFRVDLSGRIHEIRMLSGVPNRWAEQTARSVLRDLNLPPVPKQIMQAAEMNGCNMEARFVFATKEADRIKLRRDLMKLQWQDPATF
jgi:hypothetical protein